MGLRHFILPVFILCGVLNIYAVWTDWPLLVFCTKPCLMTLLAGWFYMRTANRFTAFARNILIGLLFSIGGDTFLLFVSSHPNFFVAGLGSFLVAHLFYISAFQKYGKLEEGYVRRYPLVIGLVGLYLISFVTYLWPDLPSAFLLPVILYSLVISLMLTACINMRGRVAGVVAKGLISGAILFVLSDSVIAIHKFKALGLSNEAMGVIIMSTYIVGQYLIAQHAALANDQIQETT